MSPFVKNEVIMKELACFGKFASAMKIISLSCKNSAVKHVLSFSRQVFMFLNDQDETLKTSSVKTGTAITLFLQPLKTTEYLLNVGTLGTKSLAACIDLCRRGAQGVTQLAYSSSSAETVSRRTLGDWSLE